jgi:hypothetical protein
MEVEIRINCKVKKDLKLILSSDFSEDMLEHIFVKVEPSDQDAWVIIPVEELKMALRKIIAK